MNPRPELSELEFDTLRELLNIGFGRAAASLSELIGLRIMLSVPKAILVDSSAIVDLIDAELGPLGPYALVEKTFWGTIEGRGYLLIAEGDVRRFGLLFDPGCESKIGDSEDLDFGPDACLELGNIIIDACVSEIALALKSKVEFEQPQYSPAALASRRISRPIGLPGDLGILLGTSFYFEDQALRGFLFLVASGKSIAGVQSAIGRYLEELS